MLITYVSFPWTFKIYFMFAKEIAEFELNYKLAKGMFIFYFILHRIRRRNSTYTVFPAIILYFIKKKREEKGDID